LARPAFRVDSRMVRTILVGPHLSIDAVNRDQQARHAATFREAQLSKIPLVDDRSVAPSDCDLSRDSTRGDQLLMLSHQPTPFTWCCGVNHRAEPSRTSRSTSDCGTLTTRPSRTTRSRPHRCHFFRSSALTAKISAVCFSVNNFSKQTPQD